MSERRSACSMSIQLSLDLLRSYAGPAAIRDRRRDGDLVGSAPDSFELTCANAAQLHVSGEQLVGLALLALAAADCERAQGVP